MALTVFNTLGRKKEEFVPLRSDEVRMYVCGPTVYDFIHVGNARPLIVYDVVRRYLEYKGFKVRLVSNVTDIDDKMIKRAKETKLSVQQLGEIYSDVYFEGMSQLNIKKPEVNPRATQHIPDIIESIETLIKKGCAYQLDGDVYFDTAKFEEYGKLSGNRAEALEAGARVEVNPKKRNPADFALWKKQKRGEPGWHSPWGKGRPGWHIECSTMAMKYLGETLDIHTGGEELIFPHHENEIAQSEAITGKPFAKYWLHHKMVTVNGEKMSKSLGNFLTVRDALKMCKPPAFRLALASAHYRSPIDFNKESLQLATTNLERLSNALERFTALAERKERTSEEEQLLSEADAARRRFEEAMDDDFNTPPAIAAIFEIAKTMNAYTEKNSEIEVKTKKAVAETFERLLDVLGIKIVEEETRRDQSDAVKSLMELVINLREEMRNRKDWKTADEIRQRLQMIGFTLEDTSEGTNWKTLKP